MKAITVLQPWALLLACGAKKIETRSWTTKYRGPIAIHAGKKDPHDIMVSLPQSRVIYNSLYEKLGIKSGALSKMAVGSVIAIAELVDCLKIIDTRLDGSPVFNEYYPVLSKNEIAFGDYTPGRYAWILANIRPITPVPAKGRQRLWEWDEKTMVNNCHICGKEPYSYCDGCGKVACKEHFKEILCDTCMKEMQAMSDREWEELS